jgi:hypothetical protein
VTWILETGGCLGIFRNEVNLVARSNVCPEIDPPATPSFYAFSYTVPGQNRAARSIRPAEAERRHAQLHRPEHEARLLAHRLRQLIAAPK